MRELTEEMDVLVQSTPVLLLQFGEDTCGPCHAIRSKLDQWLEVHDEASARYVDIEKHLELCSQMGIFSAPTVIVYMDGQIVGRIDSVLIPSHFDGAVKAYLDWICVIKSYRHQGVAQALLDELKKKLKQQGVYTLIALTASNDEAQRFYKSIPDSEMHDIGIWINIK